MVPFFALQLARQDGLINSESQENIFITRWFALAKKHRRLTRDVPTDIDWILDSAACAARLAASPIVYQELVMAAIRRTLID